MWQTSNKHTYSKHLIQMQKYTTTKYTYVYVYIQYSDIYNINIYMAAYCLLWCTEVVASPVSLATQAKSDGAATRSKRSKSDPAGNEA